MNNKSNLSRRQLLAWTPPVITAISLPKHAQATATVPSTSTTAAARCANNEIEFSRFEEQTTSIIDAPALIKKYNGPGTLQSVVVITETAIEGKFRFESTDAEPTETEGVISGVAEISGPSDISTVSDYSIVKPISVSAADGEIDFGGTAGLEGDFSAEDQQMVTLTGTDMDNFIGKGTVTFYLNANASLVIEGGNYITSLDTVAKGSVLVEYVCS